MKAINLIQRAIDKLDNIADDEFVKIMNEIKEDHIKDAIKKCDEQLNCIECSEPYRKLYNNTKYIPCNRVRLMYGISIWDYKKDRRKL